MTEAELSSAAQAMTKTAQIKCMYDELRNYVQARSGLTVSAASTKDNDQS